MKRLFILFIVLMLSLPVGVRCEEQGLLPSLSDAFGVPMPSLGDVLHRYPDIETKEADGGTVQRWTGITDEAFEAFSEYLAKVGASLENYTVVDGVFTATIGKVGRTFSFVYQPAEETALVTYPRGTCDERSYLAAAHYGRAKEYMANEQYDEAYAEFTSISEYALYKDIDNLMKTEKHLIKVAATIAEEEAALLAAREAKLKPFKTVGSYVTFGNYEQDNNSGNGKEAIEWLVLAVKDNKTLLISRYGLDCQPYNSTVSYVTWGTCSLRTWLNGTFMKTAFSTAEKKAILPTTMEYTCDKLFLLSYKEAEKYYYNDSVRRCVPTAYAIAQGTRTNSNNIVEGKAACWWWLRSPSSVTAYAQIVTYNGSIVDSGNVVNNSHGAVRPALWLDLESDFFCNCSVVPGMMS